MKTLFLGFLLLSLAQSVSAQKSKVIVGHTHDILAVKFSPDDSQLISYSWGDGWLILWDPRSGYLLWKTKTELIQRANERYNLQEFFWSEDGQFIVTKSENSTYQTWNAKTGSIVSVSDKSPNIALKSDRAKTLVVKKGAGNFSVTNSEAKEAFTIESFSRTGSVYDVSNDGRLFAEGGSWGNAAIKITEVRTGKSWLLDGQLSRQTIQSLQPSELELRLTIEKRQRQALLSEAKARRNNQAAIDSANFKKQVYITFEHFGDMTNPGEQRMVESDERKKSKVKTSVESANAIWLRLHNDSPLPIRIPSQSMYLPNPKCFFEFSKSKRIFGLCDNWEISIWHGLVGKNGKPIPYGLDFGSSAILLPKTSVLFAVPREILKPGIAIRFGFTFQNENDENKVEDYGETIDLRFGRTDLPKSE